LYPNRQTLFQPGGGKEPPKRKAPTGKKPTSTVASYEDGFWRNNACPCPPSLILAYVPRVIGLDDQYSKKLINATANFNETGQAIASVAVFYEKRKKQPLIFIKSEYLYMEKI
jgi:hypothetical protein